MASRLLTILFSGRALLAFNGLLGLTSINTLIDYIDFKMMIVLSPRFTEKGCVPNLFLLKIMVCVVQHHQMFTGVVAKASDCKVRHLT